MNQADKHRAFAALHRPGDPLVLFNAWDPGSAKAVAGAGAKAIATGSASVALAHGFDDGEALPLDLALANARRVVASVELPVTIDFEGGYSPTPEGVAGNMAQLAATGAIGCNFEDQRVGGDGLYERREQAARIDAARRALGDAFFVNARTDIFLKSRDHHLDQVEEAVERARAYADAGASGFFAPGLSDERLIARMAELSPLPLNIMWFPGVPERKRLGELGVARVSHGPGPYRLAMKALAEAATRAMG